MKNGPLVKLNLATHQQLLSVILVDCAHQCNGLSLSRKDYVNKLTELLNERGIDAKTSEVDKLLIYLKDE